MRIRAKSMSSGFLSFKNVDEGRGEIAKGNLTGGVSGGTGAIDSESLVMISRSLLLSCAASGLFDCHHSTQRAASSSSARPRV
jgi:hypothetical protein